MDSTGLRPLASLEEWLDDRARQNPDFASVSKRCRVCASPARADIDAMIVTGWSHHSITGFFNAFLGSLVFSENGIARHARRHVSPADPTTAEHLERAREAGRAFGFSAGHEDPAPLPLSAQDRRLLQMTIAAGSTALETGLVIPEVRDLLRAVALEDAFEASNLGRLQADYDRFKQAVKNSVSDDVWTRIEREHAQSMVTPNATQIADPKR